MSEGDERRAPSEGRRPGRPPLPALIPGGVFVTTQEKIFLVRWLRLVVEGSAIDQRALPAEPIAASLNMRWAEREIYACLREGTPLSSILEDLPRLAAPWEVALVRAGERSSSLPSTLELWEKLLKRRLMVVSTLRTAAIYPTVVLVMGIGVVTIVVWKVLPTYFSLFHALGIDLPRLAVWLHALADFVERWIPLLIGVPAGLLVLGWLARKHDAVRLATDRATLTLPWIGRLHLLAARSLTFHVLETFLRADISLQKGLGYAASTTENAWTKRELELAVRRLEAGARLVPGEAPAVLDEGHVRILTTLLEGPEPAERLGRLARREVRAIGPMVLRLLSFLEPGMVVVLGILVGWIVLAIFWALSGLTMAEQFS